MSQMLNGALVFDNVIHNYNNDPSNLLGRRGQIANKQIWGLVRSLTEDPPSYEDFAKAWTPERLFEEVFGGGLTDFAIAQTVTLFGLWKDGLAPVERQYEIHRAYPDRIFFCGGVDPMHMGVTNALKEMERQVTELGARTIKFYNSHPAGLSWRCDDPSLAYPFYEKALKLGVNTLHFQKGFPVGTEPLEGLRPDDLSRAADDFPDINFVILHFAYPFTEDAIWIAARFDNVYLSFGGLLGLLAVAPREIQKVVGRALQMCGPEKLLYGSEGPALPVDAILRMFWEMEIPEDLQRGYGYPPITQNDKELILGKNLARLLRLDIEELRKKAQAA
jgi:hypothetical protein